jgi:phosphopantetheine--protein transferase-like protein
MRIATGTDILKITRLFPLGSSLNFDDPFIRRAFSEAECKQGKARENEELQKAYFAVRFAGKEAVFKVISGCGCGFVPQDIEVIDGVYGRPEITMRGKTRERLVKYLAEQDETILSLDVSLSFEDEYCVATAIALFEKGD